MSRAPLVCAVDDDQALCESVDGLLRSAGFAVQTFTSAKDFVAWLDGNRPDCLILDYAMPETTGLQLRQLLRDRGVQVPFIFATAISDEQIWSKLTSCGAFAVFAKPLDGEALLDAVERAVSQGQRS